MGQPRGVTPAGVKRQLRRESGYGCCRCGFPIVQYHHIVPWHLENHFRPEDMMALCPTCHDMVTKGFMSDEEQRRYKAMPFNIERGYSAGVLSLNQDYAAIDSGGVLFVGDGSYMSVDDRELLRLGVDEFGELSLSLHLEDSAGVVLAIIENNEWVAGDPSLWDMTADHGRLSIWQKAKHISLKIDAKRSPVSVRAELWSAGHLISLRSSGIAVGQQGMDKFRDLGLVGYGLNFTPAQGDVELRPYMGEAGYIISQPPDLRLIDSIDAWNRLAHPTFFRAP